MTAHYQLNVTASSDEEAKRLAQLAVSQRLAACAQVSGPITSTYWWRGRVESADEWMCVLKTTADRLEELIVELRRAHSSEVPEIVAFPIQRGDADYLAWLADETAPEG